MRAHPHEAPIGGERPRQLFIAGDVDNMKELNDDTMLGHDGTNRVLQELGHQLMYNVEGQEITFGDNVQYNDVEIDFDKSIMKGLTSGLTQEQMRKKFYQAKMHHPHGDEFQGTINLSGLDDKQEKGILLLRVIEGLMKTSNNLARINWYRSKEAIQNRMNPVRATVSFAVAEDKVTADRILTKTKKDIKYVIVVDKNLLNSLIMPYRELRDRLNMMLSVAHAGAQLRPGGTGKLKWPTEQDFMEDSNKPLEAVMNRPGCLLLEINPLEIPKHELMELDNEWAEKRVYLRSPNGVLPLSTGQTSIMFMPLKESYNGMMV